MPYRIIIAVIAAFFGAGAFWMFLPLLSVALRSEGVGDALGRHHLRPALGGAAGNVRLHPGHHSASWAATHGPLRHGSRRFCLSRLRRHPQPAALEPALPGHGGRGSATLGRAGYLDEWQLPRTSARPPDRALRTHSRRLNGSRARRSGDFRQHWPRTVPGRRHCNGRSRHHAQPGWARGSACNPARHAARPPA